MQAVGKGTPPGKGTCKSRLNHARDHFSQNCSLDLGPSDFAGFLPAVDLAQIAARGGDPPLPFISSFLEYSPFRFDRSFMIWLAARPSSRDVSLLFRLLPFFLTDPVSSHWNRRRRHPFLPLFFFLFTLSFHFTSAVAFRSPIWFIKCASVCKKRERMIVKYRSLRCFTFQSRTSLLDGLLFLRHVVFYSTNLKPEYVDLIDLHNNFYNNDDQ